MSDYKNVTLKEVAAHAGVSIATVSRVLNSSTHVSSDIKEKVEAAVEELGYRQNLIARSLKTNSTNTIAFITSDISNPYMITVAKAVEDLIHVEKYNLLVCSTEGNPERELEHLKLQMGRNVDGLILNTTGLNCEFITEISTRIPVILIHRNCGNPGFVGDFVDSDNDEGVYQLTKHLISFGHRRIFVIKGKKYISSNQYRFNGFCRAMAEIGIDVDDSYPYQFDGNFTEESGYRAVEHLCGLAVRPTAVLGFNNTTTIGVLRGLMANNISVPEEMSIVSYNDIEYKELMTVRPTVHEINPREIGVIAGRALLERLGAGDLPNRDFILSGRLVPGNAVSVPIDFSDDYSPQITIQVQQ